MSCSQSSRIPHLYVEMSTSSVQMHRCEGLMLVGTCFLENVSWVAVKELKSSTIVQKPY